MEQRGNWDKYLPLVEFAYNNSYHAGIGIGPYETLCGRKCQPPLCWYEPGEMSLLGPELVGQTIEQVKKIQSKIVTAQSRQKSYADTRKKPLEFQEGEHVFLKISPTTRIGRTIRV